jgi:hypothetical protein
MLNTALKGRRSSQSLGSKFSLKADAYFSLLLMNSSFVMVMGAATSISGRGMTLRMIGAWVIS